MDETMVVKLRKTVKIISCLGEKKNRHGIVRRNEEGKGDDVEEKWRMPKKGEYGFRENSKSLSDLFCNSDNDNLSIQFQ